MSLIKLIFETQTAKKIQDVLDKIVGPENASVQVSADIDFDSARSTIETYTPVGDTQQGVLTASQTETENYDNPNPNSSGAVTGSNNPPATNTQTGQSKNLNYQKQKTSANYAVTKEVKQVVLCSGVCEKNDYCRAVNKILTTQEKDEIQKLIASAKRCKHG